MTSAEGHQRAAELFVELRDLSPDERVARLAAIGAEDAGLRAEVESLLLHHDHPRIDLDAPALSAPSAPGAGEAGTVIAGRYTLERVLGAGGMGVVWRAMQEKPRRDVALKLIRSSLASRALLRRFELEAQVLGRLSHRGIAQIHEAGTFDEGGAARPFFAMELVEGETLGAWVESERPDLRTRLTLFALICDAVHHAHQKGVIHRDLKPANVLVTTGGEPKVLDFGVARLADTDVQATLRTDPNQIVGTLPYMSPEQVNGRPDDLDTRSDVYALGVMLYELLCGRLPLDVTQSSIASAARVIVEREPPPVSSIDRTLRGDPSTIVSRALAKRPERRYESAAQLAADIRRYLADEPIVARPATTLYHLGKFARRHKGLVAGLAAATTVLVVGAVVSLIFGIAATRARNDARWQAYVANIAAADGAIRLHAMGEAQERLDASRALGDWEWRYLSSELDLATFAVAAPSAVQGLRYTRDGRRLVAKLYGGRIQVLDDGGRRAVRTIRGGRDLGPFDLDPGGAMIVAASGDTLRLWDLATGEPRGVVSELDGRVRAVAWSPDGVTIAAGTRTGVVHLRSVDGADRGGRQEHDRPVNAVSFDASGGRLASASDDGTVCVHDLRGESEPLVLDHGARVLTVAFSPDGAQLASGAADGVVYLWDAATGARSGRLRGHEGYVRYVEYAPDGRRVLSCGDDNTPRIWDTQTGRPLAALRGQSTEVVAGAWTPDGMTIATGEQGGDSTIRFWDAALADAVDILREPDWFVSGIAFSPHGERLVSCTREGRVRFWDVTSGLRFATLDGLGAAVECVAYAPDGSRLALGLGDGRVLLRDAWTGAARGELVQADPVRCMAFDPRRGMLATGGGHDVVLWDVDTGSLVARLEGHDDAVRSLAYARDGRRVASYGVDGTVVVWDARSGEQLRRLEVEPRQVGTVTFDRAGNRVLVSGTDESVTIWDVETGHLVHRVAGEGGLVRSLALNPSGTRMAGGSRGGVQIWDTATGQQLLRLSGHQTVVRSLVFSPDGSILVSATHDGTIRLWDAEPVVHRLQARRKRPGLEDAARTVLVTLRARLGGDVDGIVKALREDAALDDRLREVALQLFLQETLDV